MASENIFHGEAQDSRKNPTLAIGNFQIAFRRSMSDKSGMLTSLKTRVSQRLQELEINPFVAARAGGLERNFVNDILSGRKKTVRGDNLRKLAKALKCDPAYLTFDQDYPLAKQYERSAAQIPVAGIAEAGAFREMPRLGDEMEEHLPRIIAPRSRLYPNARHFALEVRGDSMNAAKPTPILQGMWVLCVDMIDAELVVESGEIYAVRRTLDGGHTYECTVKRAKVFKNRVELWPESTNPKHEKITIQHEHDPTMTNEVAAIGWVYGALSSFER